MISDYRICSNISVKENDLYFAGQSVSGLAETYGTPLYLMDEERIRLNCRTYRTAMQENYRSGSMPHFASKACSFRQIYRIMREEGMGVDLVSPGEIHTAASAGFPMEHACFHGNNKTDEDISFALDRQVGVFVVDNEEELLALEREAAKRGLTQQILLRITPGIDPHTYEAVCTGKVDSKFGSPIATGQAEQLVRLALRQRHLRLSGYHCHVGSQVFGEDVFDRTATVMLEFSAQIRSSCGYAPEILNLGGGYGVRYTAEDPVPDIAKGIRKTAEVIHRTCSALNLEEPVIWMEPGRSIVADAGMTVYRVGAVKQIPGYKNYVSVDGGMADNPRYALYRAKYTCLPVSRMKDPDTMKCDLVGRCCESDDIIQPKVELPVRLRRNDLIAVCTTGAYNYSMASNYNRIPRPPVVMLKDGSSYLAVKRERPEDLTALDL